MIALLNSDLSDCKNGLANGWCDEEEVRKVEAMLSRAQQRMSQVGDGEQPGGIDAFALASLM